MKKVSLLLYLGALLTGGVQAQSSVTLYGIVDTGLVYSKVDGFASRTGIENGIYAPSRFGIRGREQLNSDLAALFVLENGFNPDTGTQGNGGRLFGRDAYLGLQSKNLGAVRIGRTTNLGQRWAALIASPFGLSYGIGSVTTTFSFDDTEYGGGRVDNAIYYESPKLAGFTMAGGYSLNINGAEVPGSNNNTRLGDVAVRYEAGPVSAILHYMTTRTPGTQRNPSTYLAAGSYDFGVIKAHVGYNRIKNALSNAGSAYSSTALGSLYDSGWVSTTRNDDNAYSIGVTVPVGNEAVMGGYQKLTSQKMDVYAIGYVYKLTKRTSFHAFAAFGSYRDFNANVDRDRKQFGLGLNHMF